MFIEGKVLEATVMVEVRVSLRWSAFGWNVSSMADMVGGGLANAGFSRSSVQNVCHRLVQLYWVRVVLLARSRLRVSDLRLRLSS